MSLETTRMAPSGNLFEEGLGHPSNRSAGLTPLEQSRLHLLPETAKFIEDSLNNLFGSRFKISNPKTSIVDQYEVSTFLNERLVKEDSELLRLSSLNIETDLMTLQKCLENTVETTKNEESTNSLSGETLSVKNPHEIVSEESLLQRISEEDEVSEESLLKRISEENEVSEESLLKRISEEDEVSEESLLQRISEEDEVSERTALEEENNNYKEAIEIISYRNPGLKLYDPRKYHIQQNIPLAVKELVYYFYWMARVPPDCQCKASINLCARQGQTRFKPLEDEYSFRVILHFGPEDVYKLTEVINNRLGESQEVVMTNGDYLLLTKNQCSNRNVYVSPNIKINFPSPVPDNYEEIVKQKMGSMGLPTKGKSINNDRVRNAIASDSRLKRTGIRLKDYKRFSIILDFKPSKLVENLDEHLFPPNPNVSIEIPDRLPDDLVGQLPEHLKARLPKGINTSMINKVAKDNKLNSLVSNVAKGVASDLKERKVNTSDINGEFIGAIADSALNRIDVNQVKDVAENVESLVTGLSKSARKRAARKKRKARVGVKGEIYSSLESSEVEGSKMSSDSKDLFTSEDSEKFSQTERDSNSTPEGIKVGLFTPPVGNVDLVRK